MAIDLATILGGLGATVAAFGDPRQSLLMSQGIMARNQQLRDRKERQERQRAELMLRQREMAMEQAQMRQAQAQRAAGMQAVAMMAGGGSPQLASMAPAIYQPGQSAAVPTNPMQEASLVSAATRGEGLFPFVPPPRLKPGVFSGTRGQARGAVPEHLRQAAMLQEPRVGAKMIADYREQQRREAMPPEPTASMRNFEAWRDMTPQQQADFEAYRKATGGGVNVTNVMGGEEQLSPAEYSTWGKYKASPGKRFLYNENGDPVLFEGVDPLTGKKFKTHRQVSIDTKDPGQEETRFLALGRSVLDKSDQVLRVADQLDKIDLATYAGSKLPLIGQFFSDTVGGRYSALVGQLVTDSLYQVSGSEAPPREIMMRYELYAPKPWDSVSTTRWKIENLKSLSRFSLEYRMNQRLGIDTPLTVEQMDALLLGHDKEFSRMTNVPRPPPVEPPPGYSYSGWDPEKALHVYTNEDGDEQYAKPVEPVQ